MWPHDYFTLLQNKVTNCRLPIRRLGPPTSQFLQTDAVYILIGFPHFKGLDLDYPRSLSRFQLVKTEGEKRMMGGTGLDHSGNTDLLSTLSGRASLLLSNSTLGTLVLLHRNIQ